VRREVLILGKYFSGIVTSAFLFTGTTVVAMLLLYFPNFLQTAPASFLTGRVWANC